MNVKRSVCLLLIAAMTAGLLPGMHAVSFAETEPAAQDTDADDSYAWTTEEPSDVQTYDAYLTEHGPLTSDRCPDAQITIEAADYVAAEGSSAYLTAYMGENACLYWDEPGGVVTWRFTAEQAGYYLLSVEYCPIAGKNYNMVADFYLDGEIPYANVQNVNLHRQFLDETYISAEDNAFAKNAVGDELRPSMVEQFTWLSETVSDAKNRYPGGMYFYLSAGEHTVSIGLTEECMAIRRLVFFNSAEPVDYAQYLSQNPGDDTEDILLTFEAEKSYLKNDVTLFATYDTAYSHVTPSSAANVYYNTIGKNTWKSIGQEITWEFSVPEDGYYLLAFKVKQNAKSNAYSVRSYSLDGEILCQEMTEQKYAYSASWQVQTLCGTDGTPLKVYLTAGQHVLGSTAVIDQELAEVLRGVAQVTEELQGWYRQIIRITGFNADSERVSVDLNRDFDLENNIPGLLEGFQSCRERLMQYYEQIGEIQGISGASVSILTEMSDLLKGMIKRPGKIAKRLETFRANISTMATLTIDMLDQPLQMDKFYVYSPNMNTPKVGGNLFKQIFYRFQLLLQSFSGSSNDISGVTEETGSGASIRVWISTADITTTGASSGRDQAIILKKLIDESFTSDTGIRVQVSLVGSSDTLVQAVLAGEGPDVALFTSVDTPVNLAMRGMLLDLSQFDGYEDVLTQFTQSAQTPFWYKDGLYAFPETQNFNMLFYRTDIFEELGLTPPETWDEFYDQIVLLSNANYMVGVPQNQNIFETFLYQSGTTFYEEDLSRSTFDSAEALTAFGNWTELYTKYSLSLTFDFFNRFRSGEMAMGIMPYNQVNYLYSAAPELDGLWGVAPIPGTDDGNGTVNRVETSTSTGCIALGDTKYPEEAYAFLSWWVSAETQAAFGTQVEQTLGIAARYATANLEAFESIPWTIEQAETLKTQRENTVAVEQIPGSYYIARNLSFAFRAVVYNHANLRETLLKYNIEINKELKRKQQEFSY